MNKPQLIDNATQGWRFYSVIMSAVAAAVQAIGQWTPDTLAFLPAAWQPYIVLGLILCAIAGRFIKQPGAAPSAPPDAEPPAA